MTGSAVTTSIEDCARILLDHGIVGMPTETVYGLAAVCTDETAVARVFRAKGRPTDHPLIIHVDSAEMAGRYGLLTDTASRLADCFWPGPLTVLVRRTPAVPDSVTGGRDTVALRLPSHDLALALITRVGCGLVAPSANRFGHVSPTTPAHVLEDLDGLVDAVLDGGPCRVGIESTIVDCTGDPQILRPGAVSKADIEDCLGAGAGPARGPSRAPGMLDAHYAPEARVLLAHDVEECALLEERSAAQGRSCRTIGPGLSPAEYAAHLYAFMRDAERDGVADIVALLPPGDGIPAALRDRLTKASARPR